MKKKRTLYECSHALVKGERISCRHNHPFSLKSDDGGIEVRRLAGGEPLALTICQACGDFDRMGPPVPEEARGWPKKANPLRNSLSDIGNQRETVTVR